MQEGSLLLASAEKSKRLRNIIVRADNIDDAAEEIIAFLGRTRQEGVIYFNGWDHIGFGASAILKAVIERFRSSSSGDPTRKAAGGLDKIIHIDCSLWQSKRSLQKAITEELKLPQKVMDFFDQCDDEDDFDGVQQAARGVILEVKLAIMNELSNYKFLVVFHNGSGDYVDLWECGVPVIGVMSKRVLWTSRGRFLFHCIQNIENLKPFVGLSDVAISLFLQSNIDDEDVQKDLFRQFLHAEAGEVARWYSGGPELDTKIVLECILYKAMTQEYNKINWGMHAANYWVCDGIIHDANGSGRSTWEVGNALHKTMNLDWHQHYVRYMREVLCGQEWAHSDRWVSATGQNIMVIQAPTTSFFWTGAIIEDGMFKDLDRSRLHVLHLSHCTFSFSSPPFISCRYLRFLLLDHCKDKNIARDCSEEQGHNQVSDGVCFQKLWVLELSFTDWYWLLSEKMLDLMVELRELNVKGLCNWSINHLHSRSGAGRNRHRPLKLQVAGGPKDNSNMGYSSDTNQQASSFPDLSSWYILKTVILDCCGELEEIGCNTLPTSLESFSFTSDLATKIKSISFQGCAILKSLLLRGLFGELVELDMSDNSRSAGANGDVVDAPTIKCLWPCPLIPMDSSLAHCYISIKDETPAELLQGTTSTKQEASTTLPGFVHEQVKTLHLHDCLFITSIPGPTTAFTVNLRWNRLQYCKLERCPNLEGAVFTTPIRNFGDNIFSSLEILWASQLLKARYIWDWATSYFRLGRYSFEDIVFLHLDCCPRLVHVLPLYTSNGNGCRSLETLEIVCCGELEEVFPSDLELQQQQEQEPREFPSLNRIHLYELPMLQRICGRRMFMPRLETVKIIRGCWSLKCLPAVRRTPLRQQLLHMPPAVDCEKEWWDGLEWDGEEAGHHPSHYKLTHSVYYKKNLLRATVLR
ncbi:unnamed protein product [Urochloa decumbens]|uniref:Disease resistance protein At4g27190-like leucine-rich repeats domain-containing protein n=1 Tax=Urochloa decumbens TaxID=240449 RepID=A0ABC9BR45_9POAL